MATTIDDLISDAERRMQGAAEALKRDLSAIRTGRSSPALVEHITIDYYGVLTPLNQLASTTAPESRLLLIQPWGKEMLPAIERAILTSELGLMPSNDGTVIRLVLPALTEQRRRELAQLVRKRVEEGRIAVRNIRRNANEKVRFAERAKEMSQDDSHKAQDRIQTLTTSFVAQVDAVGLAKQTEVLEN